MFFPNMPYKNKINFLEQALVEMEEHYTKALNNSLIYRRELVITNRALVKHAAKLKKAKALIKKYESALFLENSSKVAIDEALRETLHNESIKELVAIATST